MPPADAPRGSQPRPSTKDKPRPKPWPGGQGNPRQPFNGLIDGGRTRPPRLPR